MATDPEPLATPSPRLDVYLAKLDPASKEDVSGPSLCLPEEKFLAYITCPKG